MFIFLDNPMRHSVLALPHMLFPTPESYCHPFDPECAASWYLLRLSIKQYFFDNLNELGLGSQLRAHLKEFHLVDDEIGPNVTRSVSKGLRHLFGDIGSIYVTSKSHYIYVIYSEVPPNLVAALHVQYSSEEVPKVIEEWNSTHPFQSYLLEYMARSSVLGNIKAPSTSNSLFRLRNLESEGMALIEADAKR